MKAFVALLLIIAVAILLAIPHVNYIYDEIEAVINQEENRDEEGE